MSENVNFVETAKAYHNQGLPVVPLKGKQPLTDWAKWQKQPQTQEEYESLPWDKADGFAVICGIKNKDGLFIGSVDFDVKNLPSEVTEKGRKALKHLPVTQMEETPSGGQHWIYLSKHKPKTISLYHNICGLELIGEGKLCIMAPSQGYKRLNDNPPTKVENLEDLLLKALKKVGIIDIETKREAWFNREDLARTGKPYEGKNPPCIQALMKGVGEGLRNEYGIRLASYKINFRKQDPPRVLEWLKKWNRNNQPPLGDKELEAIVKSASTGGYIYGCKDTILHKHCKREDCPLASYNIVELLTEEEKQTALNLLKDPKMLDYVVEYGRRRLIGEDNVLLINFIELCSGQTRYPISGVITGYSGSGKNESIRAIKPLIPPEWIFEFTTSTPEALKYIPEEFKGTLIAYEILGVKGESGKIALRATGEGESIQTVYPVRNEITGKIELKKAKTNAKNFITTSSQIDIDSDLYRRVFKITMKHDTETTGQVIKKKIHDAARPESLKEKLGLRQPLPYSEKDFQNALRLNEWQHEVIVFTPPEFELIINLAQTIEQQVTLRGQVERILNFVKILALIQQKRRKRIKIDETVYLIAEPKDFLKALEILGESIIETVTHISKRHQEIIELFKNHEYLTSNIVAEKLKISPKAAWRLLHNLHEQGYSNVDTSTKPHKYTLKDVNIEEKLKTNLIDKIRTEYESFWRKEFKKLLEMFISSSQSRDKEQTGENKHKTNKIVELAPQEFVRLLQGDHEAKSKVENVEKILVKAEQATIKLSNASACEDGISQLSTKESTFEENTVERFLNHNMRKPLQSKSEKQPENEVLYRRIKPAEPCEQCGKRAVEYELRTRDGNVLRKCEQCFEKLRQKFKNTIFVEFFDINPQIDCRGGGYSFEVQKPEAPIQG